MSVSGELEKARAQHPTFTRGIAVQRKKTNNNNAAVVKKIPGRETAVN